MAKRVLLVRKAGSHQGKHEVVGLGGRHSCARMVMNDDKGGGGGDGDDEDLCVCVLVPHTNLLQGYVGEF